MLYLAQLTGFVLITLINGEMNCSSDCPCLTDPPELVVQYGDSFSLSCHSFSNETDLSWTIAWGDMFIPDNQSFTLETENLTDWEIQPVCMNGEQCNRTIPLTIYKLPDQVSISTVNHTGPMTEGRDYELQCDVQNVAPVRLLTVYWYKGTELVSSKGFPDISTKSPVNQSARFQITPSRNDTGVQYRCEAKLNLGPQHSPIVTSNMLNFTVQPQFSQCSDLVLDPPELVVRYGDPVSVSCRSLSEYTDLGWDVSLGSVSFLDNQTVIWKADNLTDWEMVPMCYKILNGVQCRNTLRLTVYKLPDEVSFSIVNHIGPMVEGKKYELQCDVYNFAPVNVLAAFWYKGEELLKNRGFAELPTKTPSNKTVSHKITAGRDEGEAQYWCEAKLKLGPAGPQPSPTIKSNLLKVAVHYKPVIKNCSDWSPMINTPLSSYPYNVTGNPTPTITWHRDKSPVSPDLILSRNDSGTYELLAINKMGRASCVRKITVEYAPTFKCPAIYEGREHDSFLDKCSVMASPVANISWEKDGKMVNPLHHLTRGDSGSYVITAVNKHGVEKHSLTVNVLYGPEIEPDNSSHVMQKGENVTLSCTAEGNPEPEVTWSFQSQTKATGRRQTTLTISKATYADDGVYTCTATNDLGNNTRTVRVQVQGDCPIKIQPVKLVLEFGASASANCSTSTTHHGMGWEASQGPVDMVENVQLITWRVDRLTHYDIKPLCFMNIEAQCLLNLPVIVYKRPDWVSISTVDHTGPMNEGRQYELLCDVHNVAPVRLLTVNWYKGRDLVKRENFSNETKFPDNITVTLQISPSKDDDGVQYRCEAELKLGPEGPQPPPTVTSDPLDITVHYKPETNCLDWSPMINTPLSSYPYKSAGNPTPDITWHRDESLVSSDMILSRNDSGRYTFFASNLMGTASCVINIKMEYAPTFDCPPSYEGREHDSFLGKCSVMASPVSTITWEKDGKTVNRLHHLTKGNSGSYVITATNKHGTEKHNLTVNVLYKPEMNCLDWSPVINTPLSSYPYNAVGNPTPDITWHRDESPVRSDMILSRNNSGQYTLFASNRMGNASCVINVKMEYAPTFACLPSYKGREHDSLDKCSVMASPEATIIWKKDGKTVKPLHHLTKGDNGSYVITATNKHGTQQHSLTVNVLYGAKIESISPSVGVNVGKKVSLQCTAEGNPVPEVMWSFQNQNRTTWRQQATLNIDEAKSTDAGQYTCIANNELGSHTKTISLTVQEINLRMIIIVSVLALVVLFFIVYIIYICIQRRRSGRYNVQTNGAVNVPLVPMNDGKGMTAIADDS